ncbi:MAG: gamma-glutamyl-gamma-aminobutyrate hydrolase family protein [Phycisphaerae bacterium]|nr:gamma-glutamyl-gamma-aminobutyrate hydrolase family protein [Phycisphaerae bacterium]
MKKMTLIVLLSWLFVLGCRATGPSAAQRPLIGITTSYLEQSHTNAVSLNYVEAVLHSGGIPVVLPTIESDEAVRRYVQELDGLILIGGADIPPALYGQTPHETTEVLHERRVGFDRALISQWMASKKPILGVCLGMQFTNVVMGGTMIQDIPSLVGETVVHRKAYHQVSIDANSRLAAILGSDTAMVYSNHHQAVDRIGTGLRPVAYADDGVVEALERTDEGAGLFIQWHAEAMTDRYPEHTRAIYDFLVQLCTQH